MHAYMGTCSTSKQTTTANSLEIPGRSIRITFNEKSLKYQLCWDQLFRSITVLLLDLLLWERKLLNQNNSESRRTLAPLLLDYARSDKGHSFPQNFAHVSFGGRFEYSEGIVEERGKGSFLVTLNCTNEIRSVTRLLLKVNDGQEVGGGEGGKNKQHVSTEQVCQVGQVSDTFLQG